MAIMATLPFVGVAVAWLRSRYHRLYERLMRPRGVPDIAPSDYPPWALNEGDRVQEIWESAGDMSKGRHGEIVERVEFGLDSFGRARVKFKICWDADGFENVLRRPGDLRKEDKS